MSVNLELNEDQIQLLPEVPTMSDQAFLDRGKIPDCIKDITPFDGKSSELATFLADVQLVIDDYSDEGISERQMQTLQRAIRRRITGKASDILNSHNVMHDWEEIKTTLLFEYRDKRDILTLDYELFLLKKAHNETLLNFYNRVQELLTTCIGQIRTDPELCKNASTHINQFNKKARDSFIRGLDLNAGLYVSSRTPQTLMQAYNICLDYYNLCSRDQGANKLREIQKPFTPPVPPRKFLNPSTNPFLNTNPPMFKSQNPFLKPVNTNFKPNFQPTQNFYPPQKFQQQPNFGNQPPQKMPPPEPMEVDPSLRSRQVDYMNRPQFKRPLNSYQGGNPFKKQAHPVEQAETSYNPYEEQIYPPEYCYDQFDQVGIEQIEQEVQGLQFEENTQELNFLEWNPSW